jgi:signal transduction histidine kinase
VPSSRSEWSTVRRSKDLTQSLAYITTNAKATAELLDSFLELGRLDWGGDENHVTTFELGHLLHRVVEASQPFARQKGLDLAAEAPPGLLIRTDRSKLEGIIRNLTNNGLKFTHAGSVRLDVAASGSDVTIRVTDTGTGIEAEHIERLFTEFFQGHNDERDRTKGYGLGLAIARRLSDQLGGDLAVASEVGKGSRFSVTLPGVLVRSEPVVSAASARH